MQLSYLATRHPEICEIHINPLLANEKITIAFEARVEPCVALPISVYPSQ